MHDRSKVAPFSIDFIVSSAIRKRLASFKLIRISLKLLTFVRVYLLCIKVFNSDVSEEGNLIQSRHLGLYQPSVDLFDCVDCNNP